MLRLGLGAPPDDLGVHGGDKDGKLEHAHVPHLIRVRVRARVRGRVRVSWEACTPILGLFRPP